MGRIFYQLGENVMNLEDVDLYSIIAVGSLSSQGFLSIPLRLLRPGIWAPVISMGVFFKWVLAVLMTCFLN